MKNPMINITIRFLTAAASGPNSRALLLAALNNHASRLQEILILGGVSKDAWKYAALAFESNGNQSAAAICSAQLGIPKTS